MKNKHIPLLDCPVDFLCGDASGKLLNEYGSFPCKIQCGVFALLVRGTAKATINITEYKFKKNDFILIDADSYLLVHDFSEDALVYYAIFSSHFLASYTNGQKMSTTALHLRIPVVHLTEEQATLYQDANKLLSRAMEIKPNGLSTLQTIHIFNMMQQTFLSYVNTNDANIIKNKDRSTTIYQEYCELVLKMHSRWHKVSEYAESMNISLPHLSSTINKVAQKTASELIDDAILTDAKSQLKVSDIPIKKIAIDLGFEDVSIFCRFFKSKVGQTPKQYRMDADGGQ